MMFEIIPEKGGFTITYLNEKYFVNSSEALKLNEGALRFEVYDAGGE